MVFNAKIAPFRGVSRFPLRVPAVPVREEEKITTGESTTPAQDQYEPSFADVLVTKAMLSRAFRLPPEIVDTIVDYAEYWPHTTTQVDATDDSLAARGSIHSEKEHVRENVFLLRSPPLGFHTWNRASRRTGGRPIHKTAPEPRPPGEEFSVDDFQRLIASPSPLLARPCRRIVFTIRSRDQGWGGEWGDRGTYNGSWTWFEAGLERWCWPSGPGPAPSLLLLLPLAGRRPHDLLPREEYKVQCNVTAHGEARTHRVVWSYTDSVDPERDVEAAARLEEQGRGKATGSGNFVRALKLGDVVTLWAKARFPGWVNHVESARLDVYYAV
ncbi:hypothetical protein VTH06DRAFT_8731 [Thermothelomyces fergusii]